MLIFCLNEGNRVRRNKMTRPPIKRRSRTSPLRSPIGVTSYPLICHTSSPRKRSALYLFCSACPVMMIIVAKLMTYDCDGDDDDDYDYDYYDDNYDYDYN